MSIIKSDWKMTYKYSAVVATGLLGLLAAILTGSGEFILHFDAQARFADNQFFVGISDKRSNWGHFIGVLGAPLYLLGCWHLRLMLKPASDRWSLVAFFVGAYGFALGAIWLGSRASLSALINHGADVGLLSLYDLRYETLLQVIRVAVLAMSVIYIWLVSTGRSHYPKYMVALNPILLLLLSFVVYAVAPGIGKYVMPIALNVAFFIFFSLSSWIAYKKGL